MTDLPTHRCKKTGDVVFWGDHLDPKTHELLPKNHWHIEHNHAKCVGEEKNICEEPYRGWTVEELAVHMMEHIEELKRLIEAK